MTEATFLVGGLHCSPCTRTVEKSLSEVKGIRSAKVDWKTKRATVVFDESVVLAQDIALKIAKTRHMMGKNQHYAGRLAVSVEEAKDPAVGERITAELSKIEGVASIDIYPTQEIIGVEFKLNGHVTDQQLLNALKKAGYQAAYL